MAEAITRLLYEHGDFQPFRIKTNSVIDESKIVDADIILMEISYVLGMTLDVRLEEIKQIRKILPKCKIAILCDESALDNITNDVIYAKRQGIIDVFLYSSVSENYLTAILDSL